MVTLLAGKQLQRDVAKKRPNTLGSVREESSSDRNGDTGLLLRHYKGEASQVSQLLPYFSRNVWQIAIVSLHTQLNGVQQDRSLITFLKQ